MCGEVWDAYQSPVQQNMGHSKVHGTSDVAGHRQDCRGFTFEAHQHQRKTQYPGGELKPKEAQEVITSSPEHLKTPEPREQTEWSDGQSLQAPLSMVPNTQRDKSRNTREA